MSIKNRTLYAYDCLDILKDGDAFPSGSIDLIYLDPPFNSKSTYNLPFKGKYKKHTKAVPAFFDTWAWGEKQDMYLDALRATGPQKDSLADLVDLVQKMESIHPGRRKKASLSAYLVNMSVRLLPLKRVLKDDGLLYLHCDPTASHYLKMALDCIFGPENFRNEIIWCYSGGGQSKEDFPRKHDVIFRYSKTGKRTFNADKVRVPYDSDYQATVFASEDSRAPGKTYGPHPDGKIVEDWWRGLPRPYGEERMGYPTQKPLALLDRIILASTNEGDVVLDPFCGCGTTVHAAESHDRQWVGIDISRFSTGLIRNRILSSFPQKVSDSDVIVKGTPYDVASARRLAKDDPFEFEKWVCGEIGAHGMFKEVGAKGPDGGVDGVIDFGLFEGWDSKRMAPGYAIVQVKGGNVSADAVRALQHTVRKFQATAGILVCFEEYMGTVRGNIESDTYHDHFGTYPVFQGFSVEQLLDGERPNMPQLIVRETAKLSGDLL